jgi:hypothetical protein
MSTIKTRTLIKEIRAESFDATDEYGRVIGVQITIYEETFEETPTGTDPYVWTYGAAPGVYTSFRPHGTRDGATHGPLQAERAFGTAEECEIAIARYLDGVRKRASARAVK